MSPKLAFLQHVAPLLIRKAQAEGLIVKVLSHEDALRESRNAQKRMCMQRLRAEQRGQPTAGFPGRIRNRIAKPSLAA